MLEALVKVVHENFERLLLNLVGFIRPIRLVHDEHVAVRRVVEAGPLRVFACFFHPFVSELKDALKMILIASENQNRRIDAPDTLHSLRFVGVFPHHFNIVVLNLRAFARRVRSGVYRQEFVIGGLDAHARPEGVLTGCLHDHLAAVAHADGSDAILIHVRQRLQIANDCDQILMIQRRPGFQHASFPANAVRKILGRFRLLVSVGNFVAVIHRGNNITARDHAVLHLRKAFRQALYFFHSFAAFAPAHGDSGEGAVAFGLSDNDGHINFVARQNESVIGGSIRAFEGFARDHIAVRRYGFRGRLPGAKLRTDRLHNSRYRQYRRNGSACDQRDRHAMAFHGNLRAA